MEPDTLTHHERAFIVCAMQDPEAARAAVPTLRPEHFFHDACAQAWRFLETRSGRVADVELADELERLGVNPGQITALLFEELGTLGNVQLYGRTVQRAAAERIRKRLVQRVAAGASAAELAESTARISALENLNGKAAAGDWKPPIPLGHTRRPPFPTGALPADLAAFVEAESRALQVPPDLPAMLVLAVCAAAVAKKVKIEPRPGWREPLNLYVAIGMLPAERKSTTFEDAKRPVIEFEKEELEKARPLIMHALHRKAVLEARYKHELAKAAKDDEPAESRAHALAEQLADFKVPAAPRLIADDVTPEKLSGIMAEQDGRIAVLSAEGGIFDVISGRYSKGAPNLDLFLKGHNGDDHRCDRVGRPPEFVPLPAITLGLTVQPEVLQGLGKRDGFRGRGLIARILFSLPESKVGNREIQPEPMPTQVRDDYYDTVRALLDIPMEYDDQGGPVPRVIQLDPEARQAFDAFMAELEPRLGEGGDLAHMTDWAGKLAGEVARIAGVLHLAARAQLATPWGTDVPHRTLEAAVAIGRYLLDHARAVYSEMGADPEQADAARILRWIQREGCRTFSARDALNATKSSLERMARVDAALAALVELGHVRRGEAPPSSPQGGRPPSPTFNVHPQYCAEPRARGL